MTRVCHCVGMKTNPGGVCCQDLNRTVAPRQTDYIGGAPYPGHPVSPLLIDAIRTVIQEELKKAGVI